MKHCNKCDKDLEIENFSKNKSSNDGLDYWCKSCQKEYRESAKGKQVFQKSVKKWRQSDKGKKSRKKLDKKRIKSGKTSELLKIRRKNNITYKIIDHLRSRIHSALRSNSKSQHTLDLLGCSSEHLKRYIENQFTDGMTWDNYGKEGWHIDHIIPCSYFDLSDPEQQKICFHYTNLQPLWAKDNKKKSSIYNGQKHTYARK